MNQKLNEVGSTRIRWQLLDVLRGIAVIAMVFYHATWNLGYFHIVSPDFMFSPLWKVSGGAIAASFLIISGISLELAHARGFHRRAFVRRLARVGGGAALVSGATWYLMPEDFIFFGILHCLALSSILALPFLKASRWICFLAVLFIFTAPFLFRQSFWDTPWLEWIGFGETTPRTNDYVPIFPWFAFVLMGILIGRLQSVGKADIPRNQISGALAIVGRWSLLIYLLHQPLLFGLTSIAAKSDAAANDIPISEIILGQCQESCTDTGGNEEKCRTMCHCTVNKLTQEPEYNLLWQQLQNNNALPDIERQIIDIARLCANPSGNN